MPRIHGGWSETCRLGFALLAFRDEVMAQRGARAYTNSLIRCEIIGSVEVEVLWKRKPGASSLIKKEC